MKYAYYPGCSLHSTGIEYNMSTLAVAKKLNVELEEIPDWNCCGASAGHTTNHLLGLALPARNLAIAEKQGLDVMAPCASCYNRMKTAEVAVKSSPEIRAKVAEITEMDYAGNSGVKSALEVFLKEVGLEKIKASLVRNLGGMKVAAYYGCLLVRPNGIGMDDPEDPMTMDDMITALGGEAVQWPFKTECCGASLPTARSKVGLKMVNDILQMADISGVDAIVTACPLCFVNLDMRQNDLNKKAGGNFNIPIFYFTELLAIALGEKPGKVGVKKHFVSTAQVLDKYNLK
ncbi:MAG: CoB--CoM heterodisulfide reductase iron-sulfur subunit B family protein [Peptococcaceae bacterium]|nr:CoB--CoM heterodisulfide reductase iron-sulfur subunit B family protein [Peptococcaceae bacterium]